MCFPSEARSNSPEMLNSRVFQTHSVASMKKRRYSLLRQAMAEQDRYALARAVIAGKQQLVLIRPAGDVLAMMFLNFPAEVRQPAIFQDEAPKIEASPAEMKLAKSLIDALAVEEFDFSSYRDSYADRVNDLVEAKMSGREVVVPSEVQAPRIINLMEALQKSLAVAKGKPGRVARQSEQQKRRKAS